MYFCCHTNEDPVQLRLTDEEPLYPDLIRELAQGADLRQWPVVFLNTCWGAVAHQRYRTNFVEAFLSGGAVAVVGAEAEIEEGFAANFAIEFLQRVFDPASSNESLGDIGYRTRIALWKKPLGLAGLLYSVYSRTAVRFHPVELGKKEIRSAKGSGLEVEGREEEKRG
jgi:hypothetical protein